MTEAVSTLVVLATIIGTFGLLERRMDRLESRLQSRIDRLGDRLKDRMDRLETTFEQGLTEVRADIVRHLEWHIKGR